MNRRTTIAIVASLTLVTAFAQAPQSPKAADGHAILKKLVGEWTSKSKSVGGQEGTGSMSSRMLGEFWVINEVKGDIAGFSFTALQTIGYDAKRKKYTATWIDSSVDFRWIYEGVYDAAEKKLVFTAEGPSMTGDGGTMQYRDIYEFKSDDKIISIAQSRANDSEEWTTFMTAEVVRKAAKKTASK